MKTELLILMINNMFSSGVYSVMTPLFPILALKHNISETQTGIIFSSHSIATVISIPFIPYLFSKFHKKRLYCIALFLEVK